MMKRKTDWLFILFAGLFGAFIFFNLPSCADYKTTAVQKLEQVYGSVTTCQVDSDADGNDITTTVDADSASGQAVLNVAATTNFATGDVLIVHPGGAREEVCFVLSVSAGVSVTCTANLSNTHTAAQADPVHLSNRIPTTGTTGLTTGQLYAIYCHDGAGAGVACECILGDSAVTATNANGYHLDAKEKVYWTPRGSNNFVSCNPWTTDVQVDVCAIQ